MREYPETEQEVIPGEPHSNMRRRSSDVPLCGGEIMMDGRQQSSSSRSMKSRKRVGMPPLLLTSVDFRTVPHPAWKQYR